MVRDTATGEQKSGPGNPIRLDADAIGCLVRDLLSEDDPALTEHLARESEGVPLYLVETLKAWRDEGYLISDEHETWRWRGDAPAALPYYEVSSMKAIAPPPPLTTAKKAGILYHRLYR